MNSIYEKNKNDALIYHNKYRQMHSSPPLSLSEKLCNDAQEYADYLAKGSELTHAKNIQDGQNLFCCQGKIFYLYICLTPNAEIVVGCWYEESNNYDYSNPDDPDNPSHFTQLVWKNTKLFGYGQAQSESNIIYVVCRYSPAGNVMGAFDENVLPPQEVRPSEYLPIIEVTYHIIQGLTSDESAILELHNTLRKDHGSPPLTWSKYLKETADKRAQEYIDSLSLEEVTKIQNYGENLAIVVGLNV
ncbi:Golgi-associated plant pathogenesis-related protein 1 [Thelohanellus kitauei]|uniref:Golgi-associated plant pathogenesis-related protein 1 n=1 Tax=Thelohanellus kitauei TaxID=669202 RepID=A0A0C2MV85_THEKT|nr:Golgi-associated plant pathogenesis-related protein 1 [Thelohanellus kitauei]